MGLAIIWIIVFHCHLDIAILKNIFSIGYCGVDIFLFASGIGCWFSLHKNQDVLAFFQRRIKRIIPTYFTFLLPWIIAMLYFSTIGIKEILGNIFIFGYMAGLKNQFNWYLSALVMFYILSPIIFYFVEKNRDNIKRLLSIVIFLVIFSFIFFCNQLLIIIFARLPIFYLGFLFASQGNRKKQIPLKILYILAIIMIFGFVILSLFFTKCNSFLWNHGLYWYPFILITPGLCCLLSILFEKFKILHLLSNVLSKIGEYSFEAYLMHIFLIKIVTHFSSNHCLNQIPYYFVIVIITTIISSILLKKIVKITVQVISKCQ